MQCQDYQSFHNWKWNSLQGPFMNISGVILQRAKIYFLASVVFRFRDFSNTIFLKKWSNITVSITPDWKIFSWVFVKMWSMKVEVLLVILIVQSIIWLRPYIEQNYLCLFISGNKSLSIFWFHLAYWEHICLERVNLY